MSRDAGEAVATALRAHIVNFMNFAGRVEARLVAQTEWASVTFSGARHRVQIDLDGGGAVGAAADLLAELPELDFDIPGQIVADVALLAEARGDDGIRASLDLEVLTIEDL